MAKIDRDKINFNLLNVLILLAVDEKVRQRFAEDPEGLMKEHNLSEEDKEAIRSRASAEVLERVMGIQVSSVGAFPRKKTKAKPPKGKTAAARPRATKSGSKKKPAARRGPKR